MIHCCAPYFRVHDATAVPGWCFYHSKSMTPTLYYTCNTPRVACPHLRNAGAADPDTTPLPPLLAPAFSASALSPPDGGADRPGLSYSHWPATKATQQRLRDTNVSTAQFGHSGLSSPRRPRPPRAAEANIPTTVVRLPGLSLPVRLLSSVLLMGYLAAFIPVQ